jgi:hypothetical protein
MRPSVPKWRSRASGFVRQSLAPISETFLMIVLVHPLGFCLTIVIQKEVSQSPVFIGLVPLVVVILDGSMST